MISAFKMQMRVGILEREVNGFLNEVTTIDNDIVNRLESSLSSSEIFYLTYPTLQPPTRFWFWPWEKKYTRMKPLTKQH